MSDINITPFVDVLLVMLIIFMVAAPMMTGNVDLELPKGANNSNHKQDDPISVSIKNDGSVYIGDKMVKLQSLPKMLLQVANNDINSKIFVRADVKIDYGRVMEVVKVINSLGFTQVVLVTELSLLTFTQIILAKRENTLLNPISRGVERILFFSQNVGINA